MNFNDDLSKCNTIFFDTAPIIYYIEAHPKFGSLSKCAFDMLQNDVLKGFSSVLTLTEVLVKPVESGRNDLVDKFLQFLKNGKNLSLIEISAAIGESAGKLRGKYSSIKTLDAIQLAVAIDIGADAFLTNDKRLEKVTEINIIVLKKYID